MTEREQFESAIREAFQIGKASSNEHVAFSSTAIALEALIQRTAKQAARATPALPQAEHDLQDVRCQCCGYMTYHSEHMGCIRAAYKQALPQGDRKCSDCGNDEPYLSLYCVRCLNNDGWHQVPEGMAIVPVEPTQKIIAAMGESQAVDDEGIFPSLSDLLDFSGSNKTRAGRLCEEILGMVLQVQPAMTLVSALGVLEVVKHQLIKMGEQ